MRDRLIEITELLGLSDEFCNIAIGSNDNQFTHVALLYKDEGELKAVHYCNKSITLKSYGDLCNDYYFTSKTSLVFKSLFPDEDSRRLIPIFINLILNNSDNDDISFDFNFKSKHCFDDNGGLISRDNEEIVNGLTCSTFILGLFNSDYLGNVNILDVENWKINQEDIDYITNVKRLLEMNGETIESLNNLEVYRFRPEDVFWGFMNDNIPVTFDNCRENYLTINAHALNGID